MPLRTTALVRRSPGGYAPSSMSCSDTPPRTRIDYDRWFRILLRTAHIAAFSLVVGGLWFDVPAAEMRGAVLAATLSGLFMAIKHASGARFWFVELRGVLTIVKTLLLVLALYAPAARLLLILLVVLISSVSSHMPGRYRYYSVWHRRRME